jgi:prephenate dehydratase
VAHDAPERDVVKIAYQGVPGAYGHLAVRERYPDARPQATADFAGVVRSVGTGKAELGLLPVANSVIGAITDAVAVLHAHASLVVLQEFDFAVRHCLLALPGATLQTIRTVESHPAALAQCARFISTHGYAPYEGDDTAGSARRIADDRNYTCAAIASEAAADLYGLQVLAYDIADLPDNRTRFAVIAPAGRAA